MYLNAWKRPKEATAAYKNNKRQTRPIAIGPKWKPAWAP